MEPLLPVAPKKIMKMILNQYLNCFKSSGNEKKQFLKSGGFPKLMEIKEKTLTEKDQKEREIKGFTNQLGNTQTQIKDNLDKKELILYDDILRLIEDISLTFNEDIAKYYNKDEMKRKIEEFCKDNAD
jgi:hypothetical protein